MSKKIVVNVNLKPEILDPQGKAVLAALTRQGLVSIENVRQGKQITLFVKDEITSELLKKIEVEAQNLLSNPVIEEFTIEVKNDS